MIQITNIADLAQIGGFNPNKYLSPQPPVPFPSGNAPVYQGQPSFNVTEFS